MVVPPFRVWLMAFFEIRYDRRNAKPTRPSPPMEETGAGPVLVDRATFCCIFAQTRLQAEQRQRRDPSGTGPTPITPDIISPSTRSL
jgi:hypothetical protein